MDRKLCVRKNTKYSCTVCGSPVCNVCAVSVDSNDVNYHEENHRVGRCPGGNCQLFQNENEDVQIVDETGSDEESTIVAGNNTIESDKSQNGRQTSISSFFTKPESTNKIRKRKQPLETKNNIDEIPETKTKKTSKTQPNVNINNEGNNIRE